MGRLTDKQKHILRQKLCDMKNRCYNPKNEFYKDYGERGITVCEEWLDKKNGHKNFREWAIANGWKENLSIDRIDVNGNYEPSNCRWATRKEQANNRRNNAYITIHGVTKTAQEWADQIGITERAFMSRVAYGWSEDRLLEPKNKPLKMSKAEMTKEIKYWRNLEEQGLLLKLPCKVGKMVYLTNHDRTAWRKRPLICVIDEFTMSDNNCYAVLNANEPFYAAHRFKAVDIKEFGKTVFLTKEEAEAKLKELQNE